MITESCKKISRDRKKIYSYGLILCHDNEFLIVQNRDTEAFIYFFFANISKWTETYCARVFRQFSSDEKYRLLYYPFPMIYKDLYLHYSEKNYKRQYDIAKRNYDYFHSQKWMIHLLHQTRTKDIPFLFPKGRPNQNEDPIDCALREFSEETGISLSLYKQQINPSVYITYEYIRPFYNFISVNRLYILKLPFKPQFQYSHFENRLRPFSISNEILHATWVSFHDLSKYLLPEIHNALLQANIYNSLRTFNLQNTFQQENNDNKS